MFSIIKQRILQKSHTIAWPDADAPPRSALYRGLPIIEKGRCPSGCQACADACPTAAITHSGSLRIDLGKCLFCTDCIDVCPEGAIHYSDDYRHAVSHRDDLIFDGNALRLAEALQTKSRRLFGRSLSLRQVSAGGCNACEADINVLTTIGFDLSRFGIHFTASPRHADGLIITGPVTRNMKLALQKTYEATPRPKVVIAVGACAISGGLFRDTPEQHNGVEDDFPIDLYIPGCPPHPLTILDGLLRLLGRIESKEGGSRNRR